METSQYRCNLKHYFVTTVLPSVIEKAKSFKFKRCSNCHIIFDVTEVGEYSFPVIPGKIDGPRTICINQRTKKFQSLCEFI